MKDWEIFFMENRDKIVYGHEDMQHFTVEELYQAIKSRLIYDLRVSIPNTGFSGKLVEY